MKAWTESGESEWSAPAWFEASLLEPGDWSAHWIEPPEDSGLPAGERPPHVLRHEFAVDSTQPRARLYATAHGIYEAFLNGCRIGDLELTPGFTSYFANLHVQTFDVADLLAVGTNVWEVVLSDGWYRGRHGHKQMADNYGDTLAFLGQLEVGPTIVATGPDWTTTTGEIRSADLMAGQVEDRRIERRAWRPVRVADHDRSRLGVSPAPPVRRVQEIRPVSVRRVADDRQVIDLGQNINGWLRLTDLGPRDTELALLHGEVLDADGDVTTEHLGFDGREVGQLDRVISGGSYDDVFEPRHTVHGFQYVRIEGHPHRLTVEDATGVVVHTDLRRTGWFRCSDARINRFHDNAEWSFRDNACDIPTDCPHRERSGWTGDWQIFFPSAAYLYDVAGFSLKWLRDLAADQLPNGLLSNYAPDPRRPKAAATGDPTWLGMLGSAGWGDACVIVPWDLFRTYGDDRVLAETWPTMVGWLRYAAASASAGRHPRRAETRPLAAPHEQFLWDSGWHWGEWLEPGGSQQEFWLVDHGPVATAYLHHTSALAARIGHLLGHTEEAAEFEDLAANALHAWRVEYLADDGTLTPDTQANHVRALAFGLVPDELREQTAQRLVTLIRDAGTHLGTGFLATPQLLPVLVDTGHLDLAYELLLQDTPPSWLTMVRRGATTVWEDWGAIDEVGDAQGSLNHYSKGAVISWLHRYVAGIQIVDPGYRRFRVEPRPGGGLIWAEAVHDSPYGRI
ncbi:MAG TPA: family 78 glycoside hydrolase catalytic domain, partial [Acidimicrobiia bacterium]|nr:family 78 glycoside hydrolase catalytic domain [Acidimicrobiia bacterium]